jgi:hypothetical protein
MIDDLSADETDLAKVFFTPYFFGNIAYLLLYVMIFMSYFYFFNGRSTPIPKQTLKINHIFIPKD